MGKIDYSEDYKKRISSLAEEELIEKYLERDNYTEEYVDFLIKELTHRKIPIEKLTSKEEGMQFFIQKKSDDELYDIYTDLDHDKEMQVLAKQEAVRRGLNIDAWGKEKNIAALKEGIQGKHSYTVGTLLLFLGSVSVIIFILTQGTYIVAGYVFLMLGVFIGLRELIIAIDYMSSKIETSDGKFYKYNEKTRTAGRDILFLFIITISIFIGGLTQF